MAEPNIQPPERLGRAHLLVSGRRRQEFRAAKNRLSAPHFGAEGTRRPKEGRGRRRGRERGRERRRGRRRRGRRRRRRRRREKEEGPKKGKHQGNTFQNLGPAPKPPSAERGAARRA